MKIMKLIRSCLTIALTCSLALGMPAQVFASQKAVPAAVERAGNSVVKIEVLCNTDLGDNMVYSSCSGFLINDLQVVAINQMVPTDGKVRDTMQHMGFVVTECFIQVTSSSGERVRASFTESDGARDIAILQLDNSFSGCGSLPVRSSSDVDGNEDCFALFYPAAMSYDTDPGAVIISPAGIDSLYSADDNDYILFNAGNANVAGGGPLVDASGNLIGIIYGYDTENNSDCAIASESLMSGLDGMGVSYTRAGGSGGTDASSGTEETGGAERSEGQPLPAIPSNGRFQFILHAAP